jgi:excisionase family DNA binding protein
VVEAFAKLDHAAMATSVEPTPAIMAARPEALHPPSTLSVTEAAHALAISVPTLRRWSDSGRIAVQRTAGGHRRYSIDEVRRVRAERTATSRPGLRPLPLPAAPIAPLADLLSERAGEVHEEAIRLMYRDNASGWFASVPARVASARWSGSLAAAAASGLYEPTRAATAALLQAAEVGGASLLERHSYVETFSERTTRALLATGIADRSELIAARRLFTSLRQQMLDDR